MFASEEANRVLKICAKNLYFDPKYKENFIVRFMMKVVQETQRRSGHEADTPQQICLKIFETSRYDQSPFWQRELLECFETVREEAFRAVFATGAPLGQTPPGGAYDNVRMCQIVEEACSELELPKPEFKISANGDEVRIGFNSKNLADTELSSHIWIAFKNTASTRISLGVTLKEKGLAVADVSVFGLMGLGIFYVCPRNTIARPDDLLTMVWSTLGIAAAFSDPVPYGNLDQ